MNNLYDEGFFSALAGGGTASAREVLPVVLGFVKPRTVVDVGCGTGEWLRCLSEISPCEIVGIDGAYVPIDLLEIPIDSFVPLDLASPFSLERRFDLALSLEVAEHLPPERAAGFVADLVGLAPAIVFSAAVPNQGGVGHLNEQWQSYWIRLFEQQGFAVWDVVRPSVWENSQVAFCYRQNTFLFVDPAVHGERPERDTRLSDVVHPELFQLARDAQSALSLRKLISSLPEAGRRSLAFHSTRLRNIARGSRKRRHRDS